MKMSEFLTLQKGDTVFVRFGHVYCTCTVETFDPACGIASVKSENGARKKVHHSQIDRRDRRLKNEPILAAGKAN
jgi:cold shock CspA family protein